MSEKPAFLPVIAFLKVIQVTKVICLIDLGKIPKIVLSQQMISYIYSYLVLRKWRNLQLPAKKQNIKTFVIMPIEPFKVL